MHEPGSARIRQLTMYALPRSLLQESLLEALTGQS